MISQKNITRIAFPDFLRDEKGNELAKGLLIWRLLVVLAPSLIVLGIGLSWSNLIDTFVYALTGIFVIFLMIYLMVSKNVNHTYIILCLVSMASISFYLFFLPQLIHYVEFLWMLSISALAFFGLGKKWGIFFIIWSLINVSIFVLFFMEQSLALASGMKNMDKIALLFEFLFAFSFASYMLYLHFLAQRKSAVKVKEVIKSLKDKNLLIEEKNKQNEILIKEIHHRVKNNLQIIVSLLRLQNEQISDKMDKENFHVAINRILSMSLIHDKLYRRNEISKINIGKYLNELTISIKEAYNPYKDISVKIHSENLNLSFKDVVPIGLIFNELVSNSFKYAFINRKQGNISIRLDEIDNRLVITYSDDGKWVSKQNGFGSELINILVEQLEGHIDRPNGHSDSKYVITLKVSPSK